MLPYARAKEPVAECNFREKTLKVYYQLYIRNETDSKDEINEEVINNTSGEDPSEKEADMPDIAIFEAVTPSSDSYQNNVLKLGIPIIVVDPKHGPTHSLRSVNKVLNRYRERFRSLLTAIVNYTPMSTYQFEEKINDTERQFLLSGFQPGSPVFRRFELQLADTLICRYGIHSQKVKKPTHGVHTRPERGCALVYWAEQEGQLDEPAGVWLVRDGSAPEHLPKLTEELEKIPITFCGSINGQALAILGTKSIKILSPGKEHPTVELDGARAAAWNRKGNKLLVDNGQVLLIYNLSGKKEAEWTGFRNSIVWWDAEDNRVFLFDKPTRLIEASLGFDDNWPEQPSTISKLNIPIYTYDVRIIYKAKASFFLKNGDNYLLTMESKPVVEKYTQEIPLSISMVEPTRRAIYYVEGRHGFNLFRIIDEGEQSKEWPLIRFRGYFPGINESNPSNWNSVLSIPDPVMWSPDSKRIAFSNSRYIMTARIGDRYTTLVSLPHQRPRMPVWVDWALLRPYL